MKCTEIYVSELQIIIFCVSRTHIITDIKDILKCFKNNYDLEIIFISWLLNRSRKLSEKILQQNDDLEVSSKPLLVNRSSKRKTNINDMHNDFKVIFDNFFLSRRTILNQQSFSVQKEILRIDLTVLNFWILTPSIPIMF